jgi:hypothetical protein
VAIALVAVALVVAIAGATTAGVAIIITHLIVIMEAIMAATVT